MYITTFTHFLDGKGNIPKHMQKEARELASFLALIIDATTQYESEDGFETGVSCMHKGCHGKVRSTILFDENFEIYWECTECKEAGIIKEWEDTRWDNDR